MKIFFGARSLRYTICTGLILSLSLVSAAPVQAESATEYVKKTPKAYVLRVPSPITNQVPVYADEIFQVLESADLGTSSLTSILAGSTLTVNLGISVASGTVTDAQKQISIGWRDVDGSHNSSVSANSLTHTFASAPSNLSFGIRYYGIASKDSVVVINPTITISTSNLTSQIADTDLDYHFMEVGVTSGPLEGSGERSSPTVTARQGDSSIKFLSNSLCVDISQMTSGDVLVDRSSLWDGANSVGTNLLRWRPLDATYEPDYPIGESSTYTLGSTAGTPYLKYTFGSTIDNPIPGTTYSIRELKVTKQGDATETNLLKGCGSPRGKTVVATSGKTITVTVDVTDDTVGGFLLRFSKYSCNLYGASDTVHKRVLRSGFTVFNFGSGNISSATCMFNSVAPGFYSVGIRGVNTDYDAGTTSDEKIAVNEIAVGGVMHATVLPQVASTVRLGKSFLVSTPLGKNVKGFSTSVATSTKGVCSVTLVKNSAKKISGYSVKGLKKGTCKLSVKISGNVKNRAATVYKTVLIK